MNLPFDLYVRVQVYWHTSLLRCGSGSGGIGTWNGNGGMEDWNIVYVAGMY